MKTLYSWWLAAKIVLAGIFTTVILVLEKR